MIRLMESLHITVGASHIGSGISLENELRLIKAGLLYGDKVKLCSLGASFIVTLAQAGHLSKGEQISTMQEWSSSLGSEYAGTNDILAAAKTLRGKQHRSKSEILTLARIDKAIAETWQMMSGKIAEIVAESGASGLTEAYDAGLLEVEIYDIQDTDTMVKQFFDSVGAAVVSHDTFPLFDGGTGDLVRAAINEGQLAPRSSAQLRSKIVGLASDMLGRLPLFDVASMDELLDIRRELDPYLVRFRSAVISYARVIQSAQWDSDFQDEADLVFRERVAPAILEIEDAVKSNTLLKAFLSRSTETLTVPGSSTLGVILSGIAEFSQIAGAALGFAAGAAAVGASAIDDWQAKTKDIQGNQLYFYYRVGQSLQK